MPWLVFLLSAAAIIVAGTKLSLYGDRIAEHSGLGRVWIGSVLLAGATSLPEILTDINAALLEAPDLAVGDLFGSNMANMCILGIVDLLSRRRQVASQVAHAHALSAALAMMLTSLAALFLVLRTNLAVWEVGLDSFLLLLLYCLGMRVVYRQEDLRQRQPEETRQFPSENGALRQAIMGFAAAAIVIVVAAPYLAFSAKAIAESTGVGTTAIGASLVAVTTSLPELVSSLAAVRLGALDLAVGNLFGSNAFNMSALFVTDVAYRSGPLLGAVSRAHVVTALLSLLLMNIGLMGIVYRAERRSFLLEPGGGLLIVCYAVGMWIVFLASGGEAR